MTAQKAKDERKSARDIKKLRILLENSAESLGSRRECCLGYLSIYEYTPEKLLHLPPKSCHNFSGSSKGTVGA